MRTFINQVRCRCLGGIAFLLTGGVALAVELTRGPYLQLGTPTSIIIRWRTDIATDSRVRYGLSPDHLDRNVVDTTVATEHEVALFGLSPNTRYYYSLGGGRFLFARGPEYFFVTSPTNTKPTRLWVLGDSGTQNQNQRAVRDAYYALAANRHTDLWLMLGDNAYGSGTDFEYQRAVFDMYPEMLRNSVLWPAIGNHDTYAATEVGNFPYLDIFSLPTAGEAGGVPSGTEKYYSFDYGNIHLIVLDSMTVDRSSNAPMCSWLREDLAATTNQWIFAYWHHPPYTKGSHDSDREVELIEMRENVVPILEAGGVDLVLCGHSHSYERSYLMAGHYSFSRNLLPEMIKDSGSGRESETGPYRKYDTNTQPAVYVVAGSSGQTSGGSLNHPAMFISLNELGSLILDVDGARLDVSFLDARGAVGDSFTIVKPGGLLRPKITSYQMAGGVLSLSWTSRPGRTYLVERAISLYSPEWEPLGPAIIAIAETTSWSGATEHAPSFYRIRDFE